MDRRSTWMFGLSLLMACQEATGSDRAPPFQCPPSVSEAACHAALAGEYSGTLQDGGTWRIIVDNDGGVTGSVTDANGVVTDLMGYGDAHGRILMTGGELGFDGQVRIDGSVWGVWADAEWLRGFRGQRTAGPVLVDPAIPETGGTSGIGGGGSSGSGGAGAGGVGTGGAEIGGTATGGGSTGGSATGGAASVDGWGACYVECRPADIAPSRECAYLSGMAACTEYATSRCGSNVVTVSWHKPECVCFDPAPGCVPEWW